MVENTFSVPVVVHSLELPADAHQVFQLGKFKAKVSDVYLFINQERLFQTREASLNLLKYVENWFKHQ